MKLPPEHAHCANMDTSAFPEIRGIAVATEVSDHRGITVALVDPDGKTCVT